MERHPQKCGLLELKKRRVYPTMKKFGEGGR